MESISSTAITPPPLLDLPSEALKVYVEDVVTAAILIGSRPRMEINKHLSHSDAQKSLASKCLLGVSVGTLHLLTRPYVQSTIRTIVYSLYFISQQAAPLRGTEPIA